MSSTLISMFERQRARLQSQRVAVGTADDEGNNEQNNNNNNNNPADTTERMEEGRATTTTHHPQEPPSLPSGESHDDGEDSSLVSIIDDEDDDDINQISTAGNNAENETEQRMAHRMTLTELEEERELFRRRSSVCVMLSVFFLFRLWIEAFNSGDFGLLLLSLVGTSWTARWIRHNREREEELDRLIANYSESNHHHPFGAHDLTMLSFQAQLALAIMESQRQMMQGGYGNPDGSSQGQGVSSEAKAKWEKFQFKAAADSSLAKESKAYGTVKSVEDDEEEPHCSICLGEYQDDETLIKLPCQHVYHDECIGSWTTHHVKCPLCNFDLESTSSTPTGESVTA